MPANTTNGAPERRILDSFRVRACAVSLCAGVQVFLFGAGIALPIAGSGAWIASLGALPAAALCAPAISRALTSPARGGKTARLLFALLFLTLLLSAAFMLASLIVFARQTLLVQARALSCAGMTLAAVLLCALSGGAGVCRALFALRWGLGTLLLALPILSRFPDAPDGLFPLLGAGGAPLGLASACMPGAAAPLLLLLLPPVELREAVLAGDIPKDVPAPNTAFFMKRALLGALLGALLTLLSCGYAPGTHEGYAWGALLRIAAPMHDGLAPTLLFLLEAVAMLLACACLLCGAQQALEYACARLHGKKRALLIPFALLCACMAVLLLFGFDPARFIAPALSLPLLALLALGRLMGGTLA